MQMTKVQGRALAWLGLACVLAAGTPACRAQAPLPADVTDMVRKAYGDGEMRYLDRAVDLDGDGRPEIVLYLVGPMVCGTGGCSLLVFTPGGSGHRLVASTSVTRTPIRASPARSEGWRHLIVRVSGGGGPGGDVELRFDGRSYPGNPSVPGPHVKPAVLDGSELLIDDFASIQDTRLLPAGTTAVSAAGIGDAPSFDCAKARSRSEKLVCKDAGLSALDRTLAAAYAKGTSMKSGWTERHKAESRAAQRAWLGERERCMTGADARGCVAGSYQRRIARLQIENGDAGPVPPTVSLRCEGVSGVPVTVVFYGSTEPPAAVLTIGDRQVVAFVARSGSGARYTAPRVEYWEHQGEVSLQWFGSNLRCRVP